MVVIVMVSVAGVVALRKESVDRNPVGVDAGYIARPSLSARRAWIEMVTVSLYLSCALVSLSARRAWIEMLKQSAVVFS